LSSRGTVIWSSSARDSPFRQLARRMRRCSFSMLSLRSMRWVLFSIISRPAKLTPVNHLLHMNFLAQIPQLRQFLSILSFSFLPTYRHGTGSIISSDNFLCYFTSSLGFLARFLHWFWNGILLFNLISCLFVCTAIFQRVLGKDLTNIT